MSIVYVLPRGSTDVGKEKNIPSASDEILVDSSGVEILSEKGINTTREFVSLI